MDIICPNSPTIWEGNDFSACFENIVLGFGANVVTIVAVLSLAFAKGKDGRTRSFRIGLLGKIILHILPAVGACLSFLELLLLLKNHVDGYNAEYHEWLFRCSQFVSWMVIIVVSKFEYWFSVFCNPIVCYGWIMRLLLLIPHLKTMISSCEAMACIRETSSFSAEIMFCLFINIVRALHSCTDQRKFDSLEDPLLSGTRKTEDCHTMNSDWSIANCWDVLTFKFVNSMMVHGITRQLDFEDLVELPCELIPSCHSALLSCWVDEQNKHGLGSSLFRVICRAYGWPYLCLGLLKVLNDAIGFLGPLLLNKLIQFLQQGSGYMDGYILAISMGLTSTIKSFLDTQYSFHLMKLRLKLRSSIMTMIYRKCLCVSLAERSKFSEGEVQTFMSIDSDRTVNLCNSFHDMWSLPLQIGVALYLLYTQVKFAFISGLAITILLIPVNKWISTLIANATTHMMKQKDERIRSAGEFLTYIRTLKIYSWEHLFTDRMMVIRQKEVKHLSTRKYLDAWCVFFWATTPTLFSLFTFGVFTLMGHPLDAATVFTCVALFNTLISPLNSFPWVINGLIDALISTGRLSKFLSSSEQKTIYDQPSDACTSCVISDMSSNPMAVVFQDAHCVWSSNYVEGQSAVLKGIMLDLPKGLFVAVIGEIGSGKSSLLNSILGEMQIICGSVQSYGSMAYVPQVPWILSGSLRDNILFGEKIDAERYAEVLHVCALDVDISRMVGGDQAYIGEKGVNLSGGQRARLALARAVYRDCDIYLLDDILSAVDSQVACWILQKTILGSLMNKKTRLLCTHNIQAIASADMIIVMDRGHVKWAGTSSCFLLSPHSTIYTLRDSDSSSQFLKKESCTSASGELKSHRLLESDNIAISDEAQDIVETEMRNEGRVELNVYKSYATFASWPVVILICVSAVLMQASRNGNDLWLSYWVDATTGTENTRFYLAVLVIFSVANSSLTLARAFSFAYGGLRAAVQAHNELLQKLIDAPVRFFDQNPSGRILNRLSSDLYMIDDSLPFILNILIANFCGLLGIVVVLSYTQILFLLLLFPLWYFYNKLQFYYRSTSRELRRLDSVSRSPIYSSFTETLDGSPTIRAFNSQALFMTRFTEQVTLYQKTSYSESTTSLWLSLRLQLLAAIIISFIAVMAVVGSRADFSLSFTTPGLVGLALSYAAPTVSFLSSFLTSFTETEKEMISVERVLQYMDIPQEELQGSQSLTPDWPMHGHISFEHVTLKYLPSLLPALNNVSFDLAGGLQVGIVGRTGAGKSSIINALFRLAPICSGQIVVDGLNVADVAVRTLRERFAVVPQSPFLFEGTLRDNLDPFGRASDLEIWEALEKCHVKADVQSAGGLDIHVKEGNLSFSVGQRQLICLARALIKSSKILCLDECTANVDTPTASLLQKTISNECKGMTVLTIAHRISVVLNMDGILVFDHGILVEQGNPQVLLQDASSKFWGFARASVM